MSFFEELKDTAGQLLNKVGEKVNEGRDRLDLEMKKVGFRREIGQVEKSVSDEIRRMGRRVLELHRQGVITDEILVQGCREVEAHESRIAELEEEIVRLQNEYDQQHEEPPAGEVKEASPDRDDPPEGPRGDGQEP